MKKAINSLLGIEMSLGTHQIKPFLLLVGLLLFVLLSLPLVIAYIFTYVKYTLLEWHKEVKK